MTTLTKRMAEDLTDYLKEAGIRTQYLHHDIETLERIDILRDLRFGVYDVIVGINLLREGLDLPEVSLVIILDADKEGFLRSESALVQTSGRAARHVDGLVIMYADRMTGSMERAIKEMYRRRGIQTAYNQEHNIVPRGISKAIKDLTDRVRQVAEERGAYDANGADGADEGGVIAQLPKDELARIVKDLEVQMKQSSKMLEFEQAAQIRDQIIELRKIMEGDPAAMLDKVVTIDATTKPSKGAKAAAAAGAGGGNGKAGGKPGGRRKSRYS